jgi:tetratricopeptide (TPR) repeat protein
LSGSEQRLRQRVADTHDRNTAIICTTQIARCNGLRRDFGGARNILEPLRHDLPSASLEAQANFALEWGRTLCSATHNRPDIPNADLYEARQSYLHAVDVSRQASLDALTIDALHMLAFVDEVPERQLDWNKQALTVARSSNQPNARSWEAALLNNTGLVLRQIGRPAEALEHFELALAAREKQGAAMQVRIAKWMIAWTLRTLNRLDEALAIQQRLEAECVAAGEPDPYVYDELKAIHTQLGNHAMTQDYHRRRQDLSRGASSG